MVEEAHHTETKMRRYITSPGSFIRHTSILYIHLNLHLWHENLWSTCSRQWKLRRHWLFQSPEASGPHGGTQRAVCVEHWSRRGKKTKMTHHGTARVEMVGERFCVTSPHIPPLTETTGAVLTETTESSRSLELWTEEQLDWLMSIFMWWNLKWPAKMLMQQIPHPPKKQKKEKEKKREQTRLPYFISFFEQKFHGINRSFMYTSLQQNKFSQVLSTKMNQGVNFQAVRIHPMISKVQVLSTEMNQGVNFQMVRIHPRIMNKTPQQCAW